MYNFTKAASPKQSYLCYPSALANVSIPGVQGVRRGSVMMPKSGSYDTGEEEVKLSSIGRARGEESKVYEMPLKYHLVFLNTFCISRTHSGGW